MTYCPSQKVHSVYHTNTAYCCCFYTTMFLCSFTASPGWTRLSPNSQRSACLCLLTAGIQGGCHQSCLQYSTLIAMVFLDQYITLVVMVVLAQQSGCHSCPEGPKKNLCQTYYMCYVSFSFVKYFIFEETIRRYYIFIIFRLISVSFNSCFAL